jgi:hypothetical protein
MPEMDSTSVELISKHASSSPLINLSRSGVGVKAGVDVRIGVAVNFAWEILLHPVEISTSRLTKWIMDLFISDICIDSLLLFDFSA